MKNARALRSGFGRRIRRILPLCLCGLIVVGTGCESGNGKSSTKTALLGAGIGGLAGQAIGRSTGATLIGAGVGAGAGYLIGNQKDKNAAQTYDYNQKTPLTGTKWEITSLVMDNKPSYESIIVEFKPNGEVVTTRNEPGGTKVVTEEHYRVVDNVLIINRPDYIINATYKITGDQMIVDCEQFRAMLRRI